MSVCVCVCVYTAVILTRQYDLAAATPKKNKLDHTQLVGMVTTQVLLTHEVYSNKHNNSNPQANSVKFLFLFELFTSKESDY